MRPINVLIFLIAIHTSVAWALASLAAEDVSPYQANMLYCETHTDCAIREGACGPEVMNIHFDTTKLLTSRPYIECAPLEIPQGELQCIFNTCIIGQVIDEPAL